MWCINGRLHPSRAAAADYNGVKPSTITRWCNGTYKIKAKPSCYRVKPLFSLKRREGYDTFYAYNVFLGEYSPWIDGKICKDNAQAILMLDTMNRERPNTYILIVDTHSK